jgi:hypothetical protein
VKTFWKLTTPYEGLHGRLVARKGRLMLFRIFKEEDQPCDHFWLLYIQGFDPHTDGIACGRFIRGTKIVSTAPGRHFAHEPEAKAEFDRLAPQFKERQKRTPSPEVVERLRKINEQRRLKQPQSS